MRVHMLNLCTILILVIDYQSIIFMSEFDEGFQLQNLNNSKLPKNSERYLIIWHAKGVSAITVVWLVFVLINENQGQPYFPTINDPTIIEAVSVANAMSRP